MVVRTIEMLLEYICFLLCIHRLLKQKVLFEKYAVGLFLVEWIIMTAIIKGVMPQSFKLLIHIGWVVYIKIRFSLSLSKSIVTYGKMLIIIMTMQMLCYYMFKIVRVNVLETQFKGCVLNSIIVICLCIWKDEYKNVVFSKLTSKKGIFFAIIFAGLIFHILYLYEKSYQMNFDVAMQFLLESIGLSITAMLWMNAENESKHKTKELQMYEIYNQAFEEAIKTIRMRQHEFENHLNAIKCMQYTMTEREALIVAQSEYCDEILEENRINKLLRMDLEPVVIGFLYSKISAASEKGILTKYDIESVDIKKKISICDFVEIMGVLFDNAVEALAHQDEKILLIRILQEGDSLCLEISNRSRVFLNNEIEKFLEYAYSTKGENRGIGLTRVKEIVYGYKGTLQIQNVMYSEENYLSFKVIF